MTRTCSTLTTAVVACVGTALPAAAQVACGDTITGTAVLTEDLTCPNDDPALTVDGGTLVLRGNTVSCDGNDATGILLIGEGARLSDGTVTACTDGVVLDGEGDHKVCRIDSNENQLTGVVLGAGFLVLSDDNLLCTVTANANRDGIRVLEGDRNRIIRATAANNLTAGIDVGDFPDSRPEDTQIIASTVIGNNVDGFSDAGIRTVIRASTARANGGDGIDTDPGARDGEYVANWIIDSSDDGIDVVTVNAVYRANRVIGSGKVGIDGNGSGDGNIIQANEVRGGDALGISVDGERNLIRANRAFDNGELDIEDVDGDCLDNTYVANRFGTATPCVQ